MTTTKLAGFCRMAALLAAIGGLSSPARGITLTPVVTGFNEWIGIDHHQPTNRVVVSVNYSTGQPYNFELVAADGTHAQFSTISGLMDEVKIATARDDGGGMSMGGFTAGELFTGTGVAGQVARIAADGSSAQIPWVSLPGETGLMRGSLYVDRTGNFGGDLIVATTEGGVWRITSAGQPTQLANLGVHLEGLVTVPNDPVRYGPWAGKILTGAEDEVQIHTIDTQGAVATFQIGIKVEDIDIIPSNQNFFGVDYGDKILWAAPPTEFAGMVGDFLIAQESPGNLYHVRWNPINGSFDTNQIAAVRQWEHVTFSTAGITDIPPTGACCNREDFTCQDGLPRAECQGPAMTWTEGTTCDILDPACAPDNLPPICDAGGAYLAECSGAITSVALDGTGSSDPDGDALTYEWSSDCPGASFDDANSPTPTLTLDSTGGFPATCNVSLTVSDQEARETCETTVTIDDTTPPTVTTGPLMYLWPPNHKYHTMSLSDCVEAVEDACGGSLDIARAGAITSIYSDEPEDAIGNGDGRTLDDIVILSPTTFKLRSERDGGAGPSGSAGRRSHAGNGRVYGVNFIVVDGNGNVTEAICRIGVPHSQNGTPPIDDGPAAGYTVTP